MKIIITGSVGTGKTSIARILSKKLKVPLIELSDAVQDIPFKYNRRLRTKEVEVKDLEKWAKRKIKNRESYIMEGHLASELNLKPDYAFVLRAHPEEIRKRLEKRRYHKEKIIENMMAEALDYCSAVLRIKRNVFEIDTTGKKASQSAGEILKALKGKARPKTVSWSSWLCHAVCPRQQSRHGIR
ncbi:MAG: adenylate kinase family protein [Candidatus Micrarchaeota archaeon]|nr:adenylate kinase family protein [Candidatus Micrarchaeota archaeon]